MGLLNRWLSGQKKLATNTKVNADHQLELWRQHLDNFKQRELLVRSFNFKNVDVALQDLTKLNEVLAQIQSLISAEIIEVEQEEKTDAEILADLKSLKEPAEIELLQASIRDEENKKKIILALFREIHQVLLAELYLIRKLLISPTKELLLHLFRLIYFNEANLYKIFDQRMVLDPYTAEAIARITRIIILEQDLEQEERSDEERFADEMVAKMKQGSRSEYRKLGEQIYRTIMQLAGAPFRGKEYLKPGIQKLEALVRDEQTLVRLIRAKKPRYDPAKVKIAVLAFQKAYSFAYFEALERELGE